MQEALFGKIIGAWKVRGDEVMAEFEAKIEQKQKLFL